MGPKSDRMSVVDNQLMIHGIDGIRVMDASAMPIIVSGNTHATIVMMAERGVEFIKKRWLENSVNDKGDVDINFNSDINPETVVFKPNYPYTIKPQRGDLYKNEHYFKTNYFQQSYPTVLHSFINS